MSTAHSQLRARVEALKRSVQEQTVVTTDRTTASSASSSPSVSASPTPAAGAWQTRLLQAAIRRHNTQSAQPLGRSSSPEKYDPSRLESHAASESVVPAVDASPTPADTSFASIRTWESQRMGDSSLRQSQWQSPLRRQTSVGGTAAASTGPTKISSGDGDQERQLRLGRRKSSPGVCHTTTTAAATAASRDL